MTTLSYPEIPPLQPYRTRLLLTEGEARPTEGNSTSKPSRSDLIRSDLTPRHVMRGEGEASAMSASREEGEATSAPSLTRGVWPRPRAPVSHLPHTAIA